MIGVDASRWREPGYMDALNLARTNDYVDRSNARTVRRTQDRPRTTSALGNTPTPTPAPTSSGNAGFDSFYGTPFYQVPLAEGYDAINANYAGRGTLESGAAMKGIVKFGQDYAAQAFDDYTRLLQNQQGIGANATNAYVGSSNAYGGNIAALNTNYAGGATGAYNNYVGALSNLYAGMAGAQGQAAVNSGQITANGAVAQANNSNQMWGNIGNSVGGALGYYAYQPTAGYGSPGLATSAAGTIAANPAIF
jgi:hypothetical protein